MLGHPSRMLVLAVLSMTIGSGHSRFDPQGKWTYRSVNWFKINWNRDKMLRITDITRGIYHPVITLLLSYSRNTCKKNSINRPFANSFSRNLTSTSHFPVLSTRFSRIRNIHDLIHFLFFILQNQLFCFLYVYFNIEDSHQSLCQYRFVFNWYVFILENHVRKKKKRNCRLL